MVRSGDRFHFNASNLRMAFIVVTATAVVMGVGMWSMFRNTRANGALLLGVVALFVMTLFSHAEAGAGNGAFLKWMTPNPSRAVLVRPESNTTGPEIEEPCQPIAGTRQREAARMQRILDRYEGAGTPG